MVKKLMSRQIFGVKKESAEKRVEQFFEETKDATSAIQYAFALLLRNALSVNDYSGMLASVIQQIFLYAQPDDNLRSFAPFFKSYFSGGEWEKVITRLFGNKKNYHAFDTAISHYKKFLFEKTTPIEELDNQQHKLTCVFLKENGDKQTWSLRDADPKISEEKIQAVLELLSGLTVFEKDGVRLFSEVVSSDVINCTRRSLIKKKKAVKKAIDEEELEQVEAKKSTPKPTLLDLLRPVSDEDEEDEQEMKIALPVGVNLEDLDKDELLKIVEEQLPEGAVLTDLRLTPEDESDQKVNLAPDTSANQQSDQAISAAREPSKQEKKPVTKALHKAKSGSYKSKKKQEQKQEDDAVLNYFMTNKKKESRKKKRKKGK